ncbi:Major phosphate-irrepressible acid phosphatase precursor [Corynebacterium heidelbergense]|uniref:phosphatase PAP2 family protein n=1 Tax=Corynebacterium heidelbergense TaxID=2055947 RepID=UPI0023580FB6|nr:phosphatase PAP2 family protein [Corynebacterium heidelbergense]WCZ37152.1 Major phosphate-irrepressible acid phosphatase precursor [Corynebacterium heidelbergense]
MSIPGIRSPHHPRKRRAVWAASLTAIAASTALTTNPAAASPLDGLQVPQVAGAQGVPGYPQPVQHPGAPVPTPFGPEFLGGYISDISSYPPGSYQAVIQGFDDLRANHPEVMAQNLETTVRINNAAASDPQLIDRAQRDAAADQAGILTEFADALGPELGQHFRDALAENRLPKTNFLLGNGYLARAGGIASSSYFEKQNFGYERPFVVAPDRIQRYQKGSRDFYETSPSFPSGHTNQAAWVTTLWAIMLPELGPQILDRGAEAGYDRLVMGVHYPLDVIGGRMTGTAAAADRWNDLHMRDAITQASAELRAELEWRAGKPLDQAIAASGAYHSTPDAVAEYTHRMTYDFGPITKQVNAPIVPKAAPDLLLTKFPQLNYEQRASVLRQTAIPGGYPLDDMSAAGSWQRMNLAAAFAAKVSVNGDGSVSVQKA